MSLAKNGLYIFPAWSAADAVCACGGHAKCKPAKHPRIPWKANATTDLAKIEAWWKKWPESNIGIACGPSRLAVLDVDVKNGGLENFASLRQGIPRIDCVPTVKTGSGGMHLFFAQPERYEVGNSTGKISPGIDTRGIGGYVIAAPSRHISGKYYEWLQPLEFPLQPFPEQLQEMLLSAKPRHIVRAKAKISLADLFNGACAAEGSRNDTFASLAGTLRVAGCPADITFQFLIWLRESGYVENADSFPDDEVAGIVEQSYRYERIALYAHLDAWMKSGLDGNAIKYLAAIAIDKGRNIPNPSVKRIKAVSRLSEKTQYRCRNAALVKGLIRVVEGHKNIGPAQITFTLPMSQTVEVTDIIKTSSGVRVDRSFLRDDSASESSPSPNGAAIEPDRPKANVVEIFSRPRKRRSNGRKPSISAACRSAPNLASAKIASHRPREPDGGQKPLLEPDSISHFAALGWPASGLT